MRWVTDWSGAILLLSLLLWPLGSKGEDAAPQQQQEVLLPNGLAGVWPRGTWGPPCHQLLPSQATRSEAKGMSRCTAAGVLGLA